MPFSFLLSRTLSFLPCRLRCKRVQGSPPFSTSGFTQRLPSLTLGFLWFLPSFVERGVLSRTGQLFLVFVGEGRFTFKTPVGIISFFFLYFTHAPRGMDKECVFFIFLSFCFSSCSCFRVQSNFFRVAQNLRLQFFSSFVYLPPLRTPRFPPSRL